MQLQRDTQNMHIPDSVRNYTSQDFAKTVGTQCRCNFKKMLLHFCHTIIIQYVIVGK